MLVRSAPSSLSFRHPQPHNNMIARLVLVCSCAVLVVAKPQGARVPAEILLDEKNIDVNGGYDFKFQTSDGIARSETGVLQNPGTETEAMLVNGDISFTTDDGKKVTIKFVADQNGYRPVVSTS